ncbi:MAG TPA: hypothetical protein VFG42_04185 [Baekduia sp.]|uniref:hypothetical protein n=1 Tax=Baekduia sp. TaxID=2600305 RepID=UPI002D7762E9|nr:hypothetical protein [Baekduia sp.]HET6505964.1 hypothetical protein [Baekduia sp.]
MTTPTSTRLSRLLLVGERGRLGSGQDAPAIRRYRLARLHVNGTDTAPTRPDRYEHLRHGHD